MCLLILWFWDADRQGGEIAVEESHPRAVVDVLPFTEGCDKC